MGAGEFMLHRIVRLFPLYLLGTLLVYVTLLLFTLGDPDGPARADGYSLQLLPQLVLLPSPPQLGTPDVYLAEHARLHAVFRTGGQSRYVLVFRWLSTRVLVGVVMVAGAGLAAAIMVFGRIDIGSDWATWWGGLARACFGFFAGVLAFRLVGSPRTAARPRTWLAIPLIVLLPLICFIPAPHEMRPFVDIALAWCVLLPMLLVCQSIRPPDRFTTLFTVGGQISYAIYILHQPLREIIERVQWRSTLVSDFAPWSGIAIMRRRGRGRFLSRSASMIARACGAAIVGVAANRAMAKKMPRLLRDPAAID